LRCLSALVCDMLVPSCNCCYKRALTQLLGERRYSTVNISETMQDAHGYNRPLIESGPLNCAIANNLD